MKKKIVIVLIFLISLNLFALDVRAGFWNDTWNMGLADNNDDQFSYSVLAEVFQGNSFFTVNGKCYTNRGWKDGWVVGKPEIGSDRELYNGRYDKIDIVAGRRFVINKDKYVIELAPSAGLAFLGNFGGEKSQNFIHGITTCPEVHLPYESTNNTVKPIVNLSSKISLPLKKFMVGLKADSMNTLGFESCEYIGSFLKYLEAAEVSLGYTFQHTFTDWKTQKLYTEYSKGLTLQYSLNIGNLFLSQLIYPETNQGVTCLAISLNRNKETDLSLGLGQFKMFGRMFDQTELRYNLTRKLALFYNVKYVSGFPVLTEADKNQETRIRRNYSFHTAGVRVSTSLGWFLQAGAGVSIWKNGLLLNMDPDSSVYSKNLKTNYMLCAHAETGVSVLKNLPVSLDIFFGLEAVDKPSVIQEYLILDETHSVAYKFHGIEPYLGARVIFK